MRLRKKKEKRKGVGKTHTEWGDIIKYKTKRSFTNSSFYTKRPVYIFKLLSASLQ